MALIHDIENLMHTLNTNNDVHSTIKTYEKIQECIEQKSDQLSENVKDDLISLIKLHLNSESTDVKKSALTTWVLLLRTFRSITDDFVKVIYSDVKDICVKECTLPLYSFLIKEGCLESLAILLKQVDPNKREELLQSIFLASVDVPTETFYKFILNNVINSIFLSDDDDIRQKLIKFAFNTKEKYPLISLSRDKQKEIGGLFKGSYIPVIDTLRQQGNSVFYQLSIFVMNYCGKLLHSEIELTNSILRNIEAGFKTRTIDDRLMAYECWKVLIDNCNLDHDYLCSNKQLKLLVKPLKIKLSKHESVVCKRFEVWSHFIEALQQKALIYLTDYLDYCFGPLSPSKIEDLTPLQNEALKTWPKRTDILMKLIGHCCHERSCIKSDSFKFDKPIVTASNFVNFDYLIINSIGVCCERLLQWERKNNRDVKVKCMWESLFNIIKNLSEKHKENVLKKAFAQIKHLLKKSLTQPEYFDNIIKPIFEVFTSFKKPICDMTVVNQIIIFPVVEILLRHQSEMSMNRITPIVALVKYGTSVNDKLTYFENVCTLLKNTFHKKKECILSLEMWLQFSEVLLAICKTPRDSFQEFEQNARFFMTWIVKYIFPCDPKDKIMDTWKSILLEVTAISSSFKESVLQDCEVILKEAPDLILNIVEFLQISVQLLADDKGNKKYIALLLSVISECLKNPCTPKARVVSLVSVVKKIVEFISLLETSDELVLEKLCNCVINILQPHQVFEILPVLKIYFSKINEEVKQNLHNSLHKVIGNLVTNANILVAKDAAFLLSMLEKSKSPKQVKNSFPQPVLSTRSARIANMATGGSPKSPANVLRLFGQNIESPVRVRGSQLNKASPSPRALRIANAMPKFTKSNKMVEDDDKDFVFINKEVKIDKAKMSEHQREVMKKRRDDIPALYQDLTQSQSSNSMESSQNSASTNLLQNVKSEDNKNTSNNENKSETNKAAEILKTDDFQREILDVDKLPLLESNSVDNEKSNVSLDKPDPDVTCVTSQDLKEIDDNVNDESKVEEKSESNHFDANKEVELDFEVLDFGASSESQEVNKKPENDIMSSFAETNVCIDEKFLGADLFVGFNQSVTLESENNDELNNLMSSKQTQISAYEKQDVSEKSKKVLDFDQSVKCPDLSVFDFVSSEIDEIEQSSDIDNLLHDLHKSPVKRNRRSLSYDSSQAEEIQSSAAQKNKSLFRMSLRKKRGSVILKKKKIENMHSRFKKTLKESEKQKSTEISLESVFKPEENEATESKENSKNFGSYEEEIADSLINECQILKQLDDEILKIDKNLKENSDVVGSSFNDVLLMDESFEDIGKPLDDFPSIESTSKKDVNTEKFIIEDTQPDLSSEKSELETVTEELVENIESTENIHETSSTLNTENDIPNEEIEIIKISDSNDNLRDLENKSEKEKSNQETEQYSEDLFETSASQIITNNSSTEINKKSEGNESEIKEPDDVTSNENPQTSEEDQDIPETNNSIEVANSTNEQIDSETTKIEEKTDDVSQIVEGEEIKTDHVTTESNKETERVEALALTEEDSKEMDSLLTICAVQSVEEDENAMTTSTSCYQKVKVNEEENEDVQKSSSPKISKRVNPKKKQQQDLKKSPIVTPVRQRRTRLLDKLENSVNQEDGDTENLSSLTSVNKQEAVDPLQLEEIDGYKRADHTDEAHKSKEIKRERVKRSKIEKPAVRKYEKSVEKKGKEPKKKSSDLKLDQEIQLTINKFLDSMTVPDIFSKKKPEGQDLKDKTTQKKRKTYEKSSFSPIKTKSTRRLREDMDKDVLRLKHENKLTRSLAVPEENIYARRRIRTRSIRQTVLIKENRNDSLYLTETDESATDGESGRKKNSRRKKQTQSPEEKPRKRQRLSLIKQEKTDDIKPSRIVSPESQDIIESSQASSAACESILKKTTVKLENPKDDIFKKESEQLNYEIKEVVNSITKNRSPQLTLGEPSHVNRAQELSDTLEAMNVTEEERLDKSGFDESSEYDFKLQQKDDSVNSDFESPNKSSRTKIKSPTAGHLTNTCDEESLPSLRLDSECKDTETCDPSENVDVDRLTVRNETPPGTVGLKHINIDALPTGFDSPRKEDLPSSPVCEDTPVRNSELFSNTSDISPIRTRKEESDSDATSCSIMEEPTTPTKKEEIVKQPSSRSARLLNLVPGSSASFKLSNPAVQSVKRINPIRISSPSTERIRKMMMNCGEEVKVPTLDNESDSEIVEDEILAFTKEIPSPLAIPGSSILKRKASDVIEEGSSPYPKRKRVNFSDPPITSQKIFFKEEDENKPNFKKTFKKIPLKPYCLDKDEENNDTSFSLISGLNLMKAEPIYPLLTSCNNDIKEITAILGKDDLLEQFHSVNVTTVGDLAKLNGAQVNQLEFLENPKLIKVMDALEAFYSLYADDDETKQSNELSLKEEDGCIFPDLVDCKDSIQPILKMFATNKTARQFRKRNIHSVGQLAKMNKYEIYGLTVRVPEVSHVVHALTVYNRKLKGQKLKEFEESVYNFDETFKEVAAISKQLKIDVETQTFDEENQCTSNKETAQTSDEAPESDLTTEDSLGKLPQEDLLEFIKNRYSSEEIKDFCEKLMQKSV